MSYSIIVKTKQKLISERGRFSHEGEVGANKNDDLCLRTIIVIKRYASLKLCRLILKPGAKCNVPGLRRSVEAPVDR